MSDLYICPKAHEKFTPVEGLAPPRPNCSQCGKTYLSACKDCGHAYDGDDSTAKFHSCGAKIPWASAHAKEAKKHGKVTMDYWELMADQASWQEPPQPAVGRGIIGAITRWISASTANIVGAIVGGILLTVFIARCANLMQ